MDKRDVPMLVMYGVVFCGVVFGIVGIIRREVRLTPHIVLKGWNAVLTGIIAILAALALWGLYWWLSGPQIYGNL